MISFIHYQKIQFAICLLFFIKEGFIYIYKELFFQLENN